MLKKLTVLLSLLVTVLMGCQSESFSLTEEITQIEVIKLAGVSPTPEEYREGQGEVVSKITNQNEIKKIIREIEEAEVSSLANSNISLPIYKVNFLQNETLVLTLGYYPADKERDQSSFLDLEKDLLYTTKSPVVLVK